MLDEILACQFAPEAKSKSNLALNLVVGNLYSIQKKRVEVTKG